MSRILSVAAALLTITFMATTCMAAPLAAKVRHPHRGHRRVVVARPVAPAAGPDAAVGVVSGLIGIGIAGATSAEYGGYPGYGLYGPARGGDPGYYGPGYGYPGY